MKNCNISLVVGTRPNMVKMAPLYKVLKEQSWCNVSIMSTGQHFDPVLSTEILRDLAVPIDEIEIHALSSSSFGSRLGEMIDATSQFFQKRKSDMVVVFGDVDSSVAASLAAKRLGRTLVHLEAGLRSRDITMPEEQNRILIDSISDLMLAPSDDALNNLIFGEGKDKNSVELVGNIMIDSLCSVVDSKTANSVAQQLGLTPGKFAVATFHRPANVDEVLGLGRVVSLLEDLGTQLPVVFPAHPRTLARIKEHGLEKRLSTVSNLRLLEPMGYKEFINLCSIAGFVLTDSGGIQEETSYMNVPCFTFRETTERPVTIRKGTNHLVNFEDVSKYIANHLKHPNQSKQSAAIPLWDGNTALRTAHFLRRCWNGRGTTAVNNL